MKRVGLYTMAFVGLVVGPLLWAGLLARTLLYGLVLLAALVILLSMRGRDDDHDDRASGQGGPRPARVPVRHDDDTSR